MEHRVKAMPGNKTTLQLGQLSGGLFDTHRSFNLLFQNLDHLGIKTVLVSIGSIFGATNSHYE